jgi:1,4-dihydroxy-6-naphthoate synthase
MLISIGHSPDADDAFMFYALSQRKIKVDFAYTEILDDIQTLNEMALRRVLDVSAISLAVYPLINKDYVIMRSGASMGMGYGPIIVAKKNNFKMRTIAIPGKFTSAFLALRMFLDKDVSFVFCPFDKIMGKVLSDEVDAGLIIHEGQITYKELGLDKFVDLGEWWYDKYGLPLPLGVNVMRKMDRKIMSEISHAMRSSLDYAFGHKKEALKYAMKFSPGLEEDKVEKFVDMYVNDLTIDLGTTGHKACQFFLDEAYRNDFIDRSISIETV